MSHRYTIGASLVAALLIGGAVAEEALQSGPQPGKKVSVFHPLNVTGPAAGNKQCLV